MNNQPCKNCKDRKVTDDYNCHSHCEKYLKMKEHFDMIREKRNAENIKPFHDVPRDTRLKKKR